MKIFLLALQTCPRFLNWLLFGSLAILLIKLLLLDEIPAIFPRAHDVGELVNGILVANIAGYIFYLLAAEIPRVISFRIMATEALSWADIAASQVTGFLQMLYNFNNTKFPTRAPILDIETVDLEMVSKEFSLVSPTGLAPMSDGYKGGTIGPQLSWLAAMAVHDRNSQKKIKEIWMRYPYFDTQIREYLIKIESSRHGVGMKQDRKLTLKAVKKGTTLTNPDLTTWAANYYECYEIARDLLNHSKRLREKYFID